MAQVSISPALFDETIYYEMDCGCIFTKDKLLSVGRRLLCPEHTSEISSKFRACATCGKEIRYYILSTRIRARCSACNPKLKQKNQTDKKINRRRFITQEEFIEIMSERSDCFFRPMCHAVHIKRVELPCIECQEYRKSESMHMPNYGFDVELLDCLINNIFALHKIDPENAAILEADAHKTWGDYFVKRRKDLDCKL